jgi:hypothetical protein
LTVLSCRNRRWISRLRLAIPLTAVMLAGSACAATVAQPRIPAVQSPARSDPPDPGPTLAQRTVELPAEAFKNAACTAEEWRRIRSLRTKAFMSLYVVGPVVSAVANGYLYRADRQLSPRTWGISIGAGSLVGIGFGASFLSRANSVQLACTFPR